MCGSLPTRRMCEPRYLPEGCVRLAACQLEGCVRLAGCQLEGCVSLAACQLEGCVSLAACQLEGCVRLAACQLCAGFSRAPFRFGAMPGRGMANAREVIVPSCHGDMMPSCHGVTSCHIASHVTMVRWCHDGALLARRHRAGGQPGPCSLTHAAWPTSPY